MEDGDDNDEDSGRVIKSVDNLFSLVYRLILGNKINR